jgi:hypothetical protein
MTDEQLGNDLVNGAAAVIFGFLALVSLALAPATGLTTLPFALLSIALVIWFVQGRPEKPSRLVNGLALVGGLPILALLLVGAYLVIASR